MSGGSKKHNRNLAGLEIQSLHVIERRNKPVEREREFSGGKENEIGRIDTDCIKRILYFLVGMVSLCLPSSTA